MLANHRDKLIQLSNFRLKVYNCNQKVKQKIIRMIEF